MRLHDSCFTALPQGLSLSLSVLFFSVTYSHISFFPIFFLSPPPSLPLFHPPLTACWLNKWPSFILCEQLSLMRTLAADRACGMVWASDLSMKDGWQFFPPPFRTMRRWWHRVWMLFVLKDVIVKKMWFYMWSDCEHDPACITKLSTLIFLACTIKQKLLLLSNFNSEQQPTAAWWGTADGWDMLYSPCGHIDLNSALAGWTVEAHHRAALRSKHPKVWVHLKN